MARAMIDRVNPVQLHGPDSLTRVELQHGQRLAVPSTIPREVIISQTYKTGALFPAELPERGVGDPSHGRQHDRRIHRDAARSCSVIAG